MTFIVEVPDITAFTILSVILTHTYTHLTVNPSVKLVDSMMGARANTIYGPWDDRNVEYHQEI
ncbi:hypothetical protein HZS_1715 [Henneguya salminicola]|nr:hypothetical protein HZS_1715 [Henneguya salminicola]